MPSYYSLAIYTGDGSTEQFAIPFSYLDRNHIDVTVNGVSVAFDFASDTLVQCDVAPGDGTIVTVIRETVVDDSQNSFTDGSVLLAEHLNENAHQLIYKVQELKDNQDRWVEWLQTIQVASGNMPAVPPDADNSILVAQNTAWVVMAPAAARTALGLTSVATTPIESLVAPQATNATTLAGNAGSWYTPPGMVAHFAGSAVPAGWLHCNGQTVSRSTYANLFAAIGIVYGAGDGVNTFKLPDLRGEFVRGLDSSRGVDTGRVLGSAQTEDTKAHTHTASAALDGGHHHWVYVGSASGSGGTSYYAADAGALYQVGNHYANNSEVADHTHTITVASTSGTETRPRNVALLPCIKF